MNPCRVLRKFVAWGVPAFVLALAAWPAAVCHAQEQAEDPVALTPADALAVEPPVHDPGPGVVPDDGGDEGGREVFQLLPTRLLWQPPLASPVQPRLYVKTTTLTKDYTRDTIDTALGATVGLVRYSPTAYPGLHVQLDFFGVNFNRWDQRHEDVASDFRFGLPITFAWGAWQGKVGYEHTSTHLGDDHMQRFGDFRQNYIRDELVVGLGYRWWDRLRLYGQVGYAGYLSSDHAGAPERGPERFDWGVEWSRQAPTGWAGQPFAALDMDLRPEEDFQPNTDVQAGWQWISNSRQVSFRLAGEAYDGRSPFGQFLTNKESWVGIGAFFDVLY